MFIVMLCFHSKMSDLLQSIFDVQAVIAHLGIWIHNGHYVTYTKSNNEWFLIDDNKVCFIYKYNYVSFFEIYEFLA